MLTRAYLAGAELRRAKLDRVTLGDGNGNGEAFLGWTDLRGIDPSILSEGWRAPTKVRNAEASDVPFELGYAPR